MATSKDKKKKRKKRSLLGSAEKRLNANKPPDEVERAKSATAGAGDTAPAKEG